MERVGRHVQAPRPTSHPGGARMNWGNGSSRNPSYTSTPFWRAHRAAGGGRARSRGPWHGAPSWTAKGPPHPTLCTGPPPRRQTPGATPLSCPPAAPCAVAARRRRVRSSTLFRRTSPRRAQPTRGARLRFDGQEGRPARPQRSPAAPISLSASLAPGGRTQPVISLSSVDDHVLTIEPVHGPSLDAASTIEGYRCASPTTTV